MANATAIARLHADPLVLIPTSRAVSKASVRPWGIRRRALRDKCERPPLTLRKMGANGEQVPRLFDADADVVQFWGQLDGSVLDRLRVYAKQKATTVRHDVYFGVIDGRVNAASVRPEILPRALVAPGPDRVQNLS